MNVKAAIVAVIGYKKSGKTTVVESLVRELTKRGYRVATAKHVNQRGFSMDTEGKDTWRHSIAGANPVISVSDVETAVLIKNGEALFSPDQLFRFTPEVDVMVLEGFSRMVLDDEKVGKILCVRNIEEHEDFKAKTKGKIIASCSTRNIGKPILRIKEDSKILIRQALRYIRREHETSKILSRLPGLNCKKCGHSSCEEMAVAIYRGEAKFNDCVTLRLKHQMKTTIAINGAEVPIQLFVSEIIRKSVLGMVSSLKGVSLRGDEKIHIEISS